MIPPDIIEATDMRLVAYCRGAIRWWRYIRAHHRSPVSLTPQCAGHEPDASLLV